MNVIKRDGRRRKYNPSKVVLAIKNAMIASNTAFTDDDLDNIEEVVSTTFNGQKSVKVEDVQNTIEKELMSRNFSEAAKAFILYRDERSRVRETKTELTKTIREIIDADLKTSSLLRDNGNVNGAIVASSYAKAGAETMKMYNLLNQIRPEIARSHKNADIHIHDLDYYSLTVNCFFIPLAKLLSEGFDTGNGWIRPAQSISTACQLAAIILQTSQNAFFGGQAYANFDFELAPYVDCSFRKNLKAELEAAAVYSNLNIENCIKNIPFISMNDTIEYISNVIGCSNKIIERAIAKTDRDTYQGMESFIHNVNGLFSRSGNQLPFSSVNFGLDTSNCGRMVSLNLIKATEAGLGDGATPIFPISICKMMAGYTVNESDPNYDIFEKSCICAAKRFYPNFVNVDATYNKIYVKYIEKNIENYNINNIFNIRGQELYRNDNGDYWEVVSKSENEINIRKIRPETTISTMGCRTRSIGNINGESVTTGKGNLWFTTINIPAIAIRASKTENPIESFWKELDEKMEMCRTCMEDRYALIKQRKYKNLSFPMQNGLYIGSDKNADPETTIEDAIKNGSSAIGYIGIYEACLILLNKIYGKDKEANDFGYKIVKHIRDYTDKVQKETHMNWTTFATPAENVCGRFAEIDKKRFDADKNLKFDKNEIWGKGYYTNSHMLPFDLETTLENKLNIEAPFHELANGGHIFYFKIDGNPAMNPSAVKTIIMEMYKHNLGYFCPTFDQDTCRECGYRGIIGETCPHCGTKDNGHNILRLRRITGYLVGRPHQSVSESWGNGKLNELKRRKNI